MASYDVIPGYWKPAADQKSGSSSQQFSSRYKIYTHLHPGEADKNFDKDLEADVSSKDT